MNKRALVAVLVLAALIVGAVISVALLRPSAPTAASDDRTPAPSATVDDAPDGGSEPLAAGAYIDYSEEAFAAAEGTRVLFFHAPWCPQCRALEEDIEAVGVPSGVTIIKVDYDTQQALRQKYGVTLQTTLVTVDASGELVDSYVAYDSPTMQSVIDALL